MSDDDWFGSTMRAGAPEAEEDCIDAPDDFDAGVLMAWKLGRADAASAERAQSHLADCAACRALTAQIAPLDDPTAKRIAEEVARSRNPWPVALAAVAVAVAAVVLLWPAPPVPAYRPDPLGGSVALTKSAPASSLRFVPTSQVKWVLRPVERVDAAPATRVYLLAGGRLETVSKRFVQRADNGTLTVSGSAESLFGQRFGRLGLVVVLGSSSDLAGRPLDAAKDLQRHLVEFDYSPTP